VAPVRAPVCPPHGAREIAGLAAGGLSSRAIAERLTLSVRTVDSHLSRVFTKLNVRGRQELRGVRDSLSPAAT
jgi:DNA-binding CsgD family transcriptional regulator